MSDADGVCLYQDVPFMTPKGKVTAAIKGGGIS